MHIDKKWNALQLGGDLIFHLFARLHAFFFIILMLYQYEK